MKLGQNDYLVKSHLSLKMGYVGSKARSLGQMLGKPCVRSRGHIFCQIIMKLGQNFCLDLKSRTNTKIGHVRSETRSLGQILEKPCVCSRDS